MANPGRMTQFVIPSPDRPCFEHAHSPLRRSLLYACFVLAELVHVRQLRSFRMLLRRGVESYELWGIEHRSDAPGRNRRVDESWATKLCAYW